MGLQPPEVTSFISLIGSMLHNKPCLSPDESVSGDVVKGLYFY
jgi:hypothetical protein